MHGSQARGADALERLGGDWELLPKIMYAREKGEVIFDKLPKAAVGATATLAPPKRAKRKLRHADCGSDAAIASVAASVAGHIRAAAVVPAVPAPAASAAEAAQLAAVQVALDAA